MKKGRKSYFYKFLMSFMLTLCVPLLSIMLIYLQAERTVRNQILVTNEGNLNQFFRMVNSITEEMNEVCLSVTNSDECKNYAYYANYYAQKAPYQTVVVKETLMNFYREKYRDVFVYFPIEDRIISGMYASLTADTYYDTYYAEKGNDFRQEFYNILECESKRPALFVMNKGSEDSYLCVAMKQPNYQEPELSYVAVVVLEPGFINDLIEEDGDGGGNIMMFDRKREILLSNEQECMSWYLDEHIKIDEFYEFKMDGKDYMMLVKESDVVAGYYASAISDDYFWKQLYRMRIICGSGIVICIAASILIAYRNSIRTYRPVKDVVTRLKEQAEYDYNETEHTEFEFITALFEKQKEEWKVLRKKLNNTENLRRDKALIELLNGSTENKEAEDCDLQKDGIALCSNWFMVGIILIKAGEELDMLSFVLRNVFEELCCREHKGYVITSDETKYMILMNPREESVGEQMKEILLEGRDFLMQHYQIHMSMAVSDIHEGVEEIPMAAREAEKALSYQYLLEDRALIEYQQIADRRLQYPASSESRLFRMISKYVEEQGSSKPTGIFVDELMGLYGINGEASMETVECFKYEIVNTINRAFVSAGYSAKQGSAVSNELLARPTMKLFRETFMQLLDQLCRKEKEKEQESGVCRFAKQYIEEYYADPDLSVAVVGEQMKLSGPYLSRLFKEKYGVSIPSYITLTRINNAKRALRETDKNIQEIAEESGFLSSNVFIKSFKKQEGVTPGAYRALEEENNEDGRFEPLTTK